MIWKILPQKKKDLRSVSSQASLIEQLLSNRGIKTQSQKQGFFNPKIADFKKDLEIKNIDIAKTRIKKAIKRGELIFVSGDYDVDGICGAAVLYLGLTKIGAKVLPYIPHREKEGYGLSSIGLDFAKEKGAGLVISVDCGIVDFEESLYAKKLELDLIITDHHQPLGNKRPKAHTIVHSTKMCGTGVAWCLVKSLLKEEAEELLDLVAIATVADMMPMVGLNRAFVSEGLINLNKTNKVGLLALAKESGVEMGKISAYEIGHYLAPRLNAAGRLESAMDALRLVCTKDCTKADDLAKKLGGINTQRKELTLKAIESAKLKIIEEKKIHVLWDEDWNPGIVGLVAGRVSEETGKPTVAISKGVEFSKGSARSVDGLNIVEVIRQCSDILVAVGGHPGAAGFTIHSSKIIEFQRRLEVLVDGKTSKERSLVIEAKLATSEINLELAKKLEAFEPYGIENPRPVLASEGVKLTNLKTVGVGKHLKGKVDGIDFIAFGKGDLEEILQEGILASVAYNLEVDNFSGIEKPQLNMKDLQL